MCRTFSGKVRRLKAHRIASASRLRPSGSSSAAASTAAATPLQGQHAQLDAQRAQQELQSLKLEALPNTGLPQLSPARASGQALSRQHAQQAQQVLSIKQRSNPNSNPRKQQGPGYTPEELLYIAQQHRLSPTPRHAANRSALQPLSAAAAGHAMHELPRQHPQQAQHLQPFLSLQQQQQQSHEQQQQQTAMLPDSLSRARGSRPRAADDAANLACVGRVVQPGDSEQGRMTKSGPLQQPHADGLVAAVPDLFEVSILWCTSLDATFYPYPALPLPLPPSILKSLLCIASCLSS